MQENGCGELLRRLRNAAGVTLLELQVMTGVNRELLRRYETGAAVPPDKRLRVILAKLGAPDTTPVGAAAVAAAASARGSVVVATPGEVSDATLEAIVGIYFKMSGQPREAVLEDVVRSAFADALRGRGRDES